MVAPLHFDRCRGRAYATELRALDQARRISGTWWHCARCGHWHAGRRLTLLQTFVRKAA
jgi:hypothetical protein